MHTNFPRHALALLLLLLLAPGAIAQMASDMPMDADAAATDMATMVDDAPTATETPVALDQTVDAPEAPTATPDLDAVVVVVDATDADATTTTTGAEGAAMETGPAAPEVSDDGDVTAVATPEATPEPTAEPTTSPEESTPDMPTPEAADLAVVTATVTVTGNCGPSAEATISNESPTATDDTATSAGPPGPLYTGAAEKGQAVGAGAAIALLALVVAAVL